VAFADAQTDFWRLTDYGFIRDNAHIYGESIATDFDLSVRVRPNMRSNTTRRRGGASRRESLDQDRCGDVRRYVALQCRGDDRPFELGRCDLPQSFNYLNLNSRAGVTRSISAIR